MSCYIDNVFYLIITLQISNHFQRIFIIFFLVTCVYYSDRKGKKLGHL